MELHLHSHRWEARQPDWAVAAVSGFAAGAVLMVLELLWSTNLMGATPWTMSHMIAAIVQGPSVLQSYEFSVGVVSLALFTHYVLGIVFGLILAAIMAPFHLDSSAGIALFTGAVFGVALYFLDFYGMSRFFPWFTELRGGVTLLAHVIFGMVTAGMYWYLEEPAR
jgi:hypothetical protein